MTNLFSFTHDGEKLVGTQAGVYQDGTPAIDILTEDGEPYVRLTVCVPGTKLAPNEFLVKDWSENLPTFNRLQALGLIKPTGRTVPTGFVQAKVCTLGA